MTETVAVQQSSPLAPAIEQALITGDLSALTPEQRVRLYQETCASLGLNPLTKPMEYLHLNGKLRLYATRNCSDQLRALHDVRIEIQTREFWQDLYIVGVRASLPNGRTDDEIGVVPIIGLKGEALANALMKALTKAKRRVTLSIVGLSMLDESEIESVGALVYQEQPSREPVPDPLGGLIGQDRSKAAAIRENARVDASEQERHVIREADKRRREQGIHSNMIDDGYTDLKSTDAEVKATVATTTPAAEVSSPFVDLVPQGHVSQVVQVPVTPAASGAASSDKGEPTGKQEPARKPIDKLNPQESVFRIQDELKRLCGSGQDPTTRQHRTDVLTEVFGPEINTVAKASSKLGKTALHRGLYRLAAMKTEQPADPSLGSEAATPSQAEISASDDKEDVPTFPPPDGHPQEGVQTPPGATQAAGTSQDAAVDSNDEDEAEEPAEEPKMQGMVVDPGDVRILQLWAGMNGQLEILEAMVEGKPMEDGTPILARATYKVIRQAINREIAAAKVGA